MHWIKKFLTFQEREEHRLGRVQLKIVSNQFLEKDSK